MGVERLLQGVVAELAARGPRHDDHVRRVREHHPPPHEQDQRARHGGDGHWQGWRQGGSVATFGVVLADHAVTGEGGTGSCSLVSSEWSSLVTTNMPSNGNTVLC